MYDEPLIMRLFFDFQLKSDYYMQSFDSELKASTCNPDAWRLQDHQAGSNSTGSFDSGFVNGWNLKVE